MTPGAPGPSRGGGYRPFEVSEALFEAALLVLFSLPVVISLAVVLQICPGSPPGVWVCSTDMLLSLPLDYGEPLRC